MHCEAPGDSHLPRGHWLHGKAFSTSRYSVFQGDQTLESLAPKMTTHFFPNAAAICVGPVSLPTDKDEPASSATSPRRSSESRMTPDPKCSLAAAAIGSWPGARLKPV